MAAAIPPAGLDQDELEYWRHDPAAYEAIERLHVAFERLADALDEQVNAIGVQFSMMYEPHRSFYLEKGNSAFTERRRLREARRQAETAQAQWAAAVSHAGELLRRRTLEGGE
jgi:hypothetical protein